MARGAAILCRRREYLATLSLSKKSSNNASLFRHCRVVFALDRFGRTELLHNEEGWANKYLVIFIAKCMAIYNGTLYDFICTAGGVRSVLEVQCQFFQKFL